MKMNLANKLTIFRIILVPVIMAIPIIDNLIGIPGTFLGISSAFWIMNIIFIIASITDKLDGYIARSRNEVTTFGKFLDPLADKILVLSALVILVEYGKIPSWIPIIVLAREFIVSGYRLVAVEKGGKVIAASIWGKLKTVTQMIAIIFCFLDKFSFGQFIFRVSDEASAVANSASIYMTTGQFVINIISAVMLVISVVATIFSGVDYLKNGKDLLYAILNKAVSLHIQIELIKLFLKYGEVNKSNIKEIGVTDSLKPFINMYLNYYSKLDELPFDNDQRHLMGFLFASYMHDSGDGANYLRDINRVINDVSFDDILSSIGIHTTNSDGYDLDIASKKVLKKIYERAVIKYE